MKNTLEGINCRLEDAEEYISSLEDGVVKSPNQNKKKEKRILKNEDSLRDFWDNIKLTNIHLIGLSEGEERKDRKPI